MKRINLCKVIIVLFAPLALLAQGENWIYRYNGPGNLWDAANSIDYGDDGNIYVAGCNYGSRTYYDFTVISLTTAGDTNWVYLYNGPDDSYDVASSIVYGTDGNIYAAGWSSSNSTSLDFTVISLTDEGNVNWVYRYDGLVNGMDDAISIAYGVDGNVYAAGYSEGSGTSFDIIVISLTAAGDTNWVYRYNGPGNYMDEASSIVCGADSNIYVAGYSIGSGTASDLTVISISNTGSTNWVYRYNGPGNDNDEAYSIVYGTDGNIYVAGTSDYVASMYGDCIVISLTTAGDTNWVYRYNGSGNSVDVANSIAWGADGNIYAAGYSVGSGTLYDFTVISLTTAGDTNWVYLYDGPSTNMDMASSVIYGNDANIYAAGYSTTGYSYRDITVISLTTAGNSNWVYRYNGPGNSYDEVNSLVYGNDGNIYAAGFSTGYSSDDDFTVISLPPDYGVGEENAVVRKEDNGTTIFSGPLQLPQGKKCRIFDITGSIVNPEAIKPGIYFVQIDNKLIQKMVKVR